MNLKDGAVAQLVEQRTENPCVPGSSPGGATSPERMFGAFLYLILNLKLLNCVLSSFN